MRAKVIATLKLSNNPYCEDQDIGSRKADRIKGFYNPHMPMEGGLPIWSRNYRKARAILSDLT
ncbi:MAG: hypothetical protein EBU34_13905 [Alphaproteobacteria bacterium]|nr:hypothetical protein [Alphaproteobacteria bacterium]